LTVFDAPYEDNLARLAAAEVLVVEVVCDVVTLNTHPGQAFRRHLAHAIVVGAHALRLTDLVEKIGNGTKSHWNILSGLREAEFVSSNVNNRMDVSSAGFALQHYRIGGPGRSGFCGPGRYASLASQPIVKFSNWKCALGAPIFLP
jgi:hypothetical protein